MQSANIPQGPRNPNGYTEEEILHELRGLRGSRKVSFRYEHLDRDMNRIKDLDNVLGGSVQMSYTSGIKRTATFEMRGSGGIDFLNDQIKPWYRLHMPPRWTEETQVLDAEFDNSFSYAVTGAATYETIAETGDPVESISGDLFHVDDPLYRGDYTLQLGETATGTGGYFVTPVHDLNGDVRRFRGFMYFADGANHQHIWRDETGEFFGGWAYDSTKSGFMVNGAYGQVYLSGTDVGASMYDDFKDKWVRVEIDFDYEQMKTFYRFYWTSPQLGTVADFEYEADIAYTERVSGFEIEKGDDIEGFTSAAVYISRCSLGDVDTVPSQPNPTDNDWVEWPLGVFLLSTPTQIATDGVVTREVDAYDRSQMFVDDKLTERFSLVKGQKYTDLINQLLDSVNPNLPRIIEPSNYVVGKAREFEVGMELKEALDRLAESINYHTMQVDEDGAVVYRPYVSPSDRTPEFDYSDNEISIMYDDVESEFDIYNIANVWIVSLSEVEGDPFYVKLENNDPANPLSIPRRGRRIVDFREQEEGVDPNTIMSKAKRIQFEANRQYENISFTTLSNPLHSTNDCYTINYGDLNIKNKYTETGWEFELAAGAPMSHSARRDVQLDPELFEGFVEGDMTVNGSVTAGNMAWGFVSMNVPSNYVNKPYSVTVSGLDLKGTGGVDVFVTPAAGSGGISVINGVTTQEETPTGFKVYLYRTASGVTDVYWLALRKV